MGKQMFELLFLCQPRGVMSPTSWGQGVYMTWAWSADCGLKPNGHTSRCLLPETINLPPPGQTQLVFMDSHREGRDIPFRMQMLCSFIVISRGTQLLVYNSAWIRSHHNRNLHCKANCGEINANSTFSEFRREKTAAFYKIMFKVKVPWHYV